MAKSRNHNNPRKEMSFLEHLEALRWHLIRSILAVLAAAIAAFIAKSFIFDQILFAPKDPNFITYRILCKISDFFGQGDDLCVTEIPIKIQSLTMAGQFNT